MHQKHFPGNTCCIFSLFKQFWTIENSKWKQICNIIHLACFIFRFVNCKWFQIGKNNFQIKLSQLRAFCACEKGFELSRFKLWMILLGLKYSCLKITKLLKLFLRFSRLIKENETKKNMKTVYHRARKIVSSFSFHKMLVNIQIYDMTTIF